MANLQQIIEYLKKKSAPAQADASMMPMPAMPAMPLTPPAIGPSSFDLNVSTTPTAVAGRLPTPPVEQPFKLTSVNPPPELDINRLLAMPAAPETEAPMPAPAPPPMPAPSAPPPMPAPAAPSPVDAMLAPEPEKGTDFSDIGRIIGRAMSGIADAQSARAGTRTNFMGGANEAATVAEASAKARMDDDPSSPQSKFAQSILSKYTGKKPADLASVPYSKAVKVIPMIEQLYKSEAESKDKAFDRSIKERELGLKERELGLKTGAAAGGKAIPGFRATGQVTIDDTEAKKLREGVAEFQTFKRGVDEYRRMIEAHGTTEVFDRGTLAKMNALSKNLQLKVKNLAQLGVLSASDIPFIEKQIPGPGLFKTASGMKGALDATDSMMSSAIRDRMGASGYEPDESMAKLLGTGGGTGGGKPKTVTQNGHTYTLNPNTGQYE